MEPNQSRPASPSGGRVSPFRGKGFKTGSSKRFSRPVSCPESPRNAMDVDTISSQDDSNIQMKPSVHFNIIPPIPRKRTAIRVIQASSIDSDNRESFGDVSYHDRDMESFELQNNGPSRMASFSRHDSMSSIKPLPAPRRHIQRSAGNLSRIETDDMFLPPIVNPRSYHKGLIGVVGGSGNILPSKIPRRKSSVSTPNIRNNSISSISSSRRNSRVSSSTDRLNVRRNMSISPQRKYGNDFGGSMIDLGGTTPTVLTLARPINRISKPTTLSPIVGTPNKDCEQDSSYCGNSTLMKCGSDSPTKIPIRRSSSINTNTTSRAGSKVNSRESSPTKPSPTKSPTKIPQKVNQKNGSPKKGVKNSTDKCTKPPAPNAVNKESSSTKKEPSISREKSSVKKAPPATIKREPSTLKRQPSNLKRQSSQQKLKRENSSIDIGGSKPVTKPNSRREPSSTTLLKNQSDSSLAKRLEKKNSFKQKRRTSSESDGLNEKDTANLSDKLMPFTKTNGLSMTTAAITSQPIQITTAVTDHLSKKNSSGQIVSNDNSNANENPSSDNNNNNIIANNVVADASAGTKSDATTVASAVSNASATDKVVSATSASAATIASDANGNLDVSSNKKQENNKIESDANGNDLSKSSDAAAPHVLEKNLSTRTIVSKGDAVSVLGTPIVPESIERELIGTPIETKVNVIDNTLTNSVHSDALQTKSDNIMQIQEHSTSDALTITERMDNENQSSAGGGVGDNGIRSHTDPSSEAKNQM